MEVEIIYSMKVHACNMLFTCHGYTQHMLHKGFQNLIFLLHRPFLHHRALIQSETVFLKRSKYSQSSNAKLSIEHEDRDHTFAADSDVSQRAVSQLMVGLAPCTQKAGDTKGSLQVQLCSPSGSMDEYLAGPVEVDNANSSDPTDSCSNQVDNAPEALQSECIRSKETPVKVDDDSDKITKYMEIGNDINLLGSSLKPASGEQNVQHVETQSAEGGQEGSRNNNTQVIPGKSQTGEHAGVLSHELVENKTPDLEVDRDNRSPLENDSHSRRSESRKASTISMSTIRIAFLRVPSVTTAVELLSSRSRMSLKLGLRILLLLLRRGCTWTYVPAAPLGKELEEALKSRLPQAIFGQIKRAKISRLYQHQVPSRLRLC